MVLAVFRDFMNLVYPRVCLSCHEILNRGEKMLCTGCMFQLPRTDHHLIKLNSTSIKFIGKIPLIHAFSYLKFSKSGITQKILHHLKYRDNPEIAQILGIWYGQTLVESGYDSLFDVVIPVPLHRIKLRKRGYNQSDYFARGLSESLNVISNESCVKRINNTDTQTKKSRTERWTNVSGVFTVVDIPAIVDKRVLLVDDVVTSGATLEACGAAIISGGCKSLSIATIATA